MKDTKGIVQKIQNKNQNSGSSLSLSIKDGKKFNWNSGSDNLKDKSQGYKSDSFVVPKHSKEDQAHAQARITAALDKWTKQYTSTSKAGGQLQHYTASCLNRYIYMLVNNTSMY